jgi:hypothetical protein
MEASGEELVLDGNATAQDVSRAVLPVYRRG